MQAICFQPAQAPVSRTGSSGIDLRLRWATTGLYEVTSFRQPFSTMPSI
ncbi:MAG: multidrug ABC transporter ATP-binding protein, partial [Mesorhizobium sp.]